MEQDEKRLSRFSGLGMEKNALQIEDQVCESLRAFSLQVFARMFSNHVLFQDVSLYILERVHQALSQLFLPL